MTENTAPQGHVCPQNPHHGALQARAPNKQPPEQRWCGMWFHCDHCTSTVLVMSPELIAFLGRVA